MKALFILNGSSGNRGCEAILMSTWDLLRQADPKASAINSVLRDPRTETATYLQQPGLLHRCHPGPGSAQFLAWQWAKRVHGMHYNFERFLSDADVVMSLGGDNYSLDYNSVNKYLDGNDRVLAAGKPLVIWGASVGPFTAEPETEVRVAEQFKRIALVVAREHRTVAYLDSIGVRDNVMLLPDPAFSLKSVPVTLPDAQEAMLQAGAIGLNLSPLLARYRDGMDNWLEDATGWVRSIIENSNRPVLLVPHVFEPGNDDQAFMAQIMERIKAPENRLALLDGRNLSCMQIKHIISRLHVFIGARTHATIAAMSSGVPTLSIGYSVKARGINEEVFGSTEWVVTHQGLNAATLVARYKTLEDKVEPVRDALVQRMRAYSMNAQDVQNVLSRVIP